MHDQFDFDGLVAIGFFPESLRHDYESQAGRICEFFGYNSVYEYSANYHFAAYTPKKGLIIE